MENRTFLVHFFGCLVFLSMPVLFSPDLGNTVDLFSIPPFQRDLLSSFLLLLFFYVNHYVLIPKFYFTKKIVVYIGLVLLCALIVTLVPEMLMWGFNPPHHGPPHHGPGPHNGKPPVMMIFSHVFLQFFVVLIFSLMLKIRERLKQIETEKTNAELSYLKAQINPHFLFNTLNSIYSLAILKSEKTADALVKLSDMMRYVLNDGNSKFVFLEKELNYIANYIELQKMRLSSNVKLSYHCEGEPDTKKIAPLVLIPFIENAFKHGVNSEEDSDIEIKIHITETQLHLMVKNLCVTTNNNTLNKSGLGIENTKQRLKLLYPESHLLKITTLDNSFTVNLTLNIHD